ncbi:MAG: hypothetical protein H6Q05_2022 [Acidobacteria bacterium]|nr:hypothetical protein [Acidobacteriota bacterium]
MVVRNTTKALCVLLFLLLAASAASQGKIKPWTQWNQRDAEKILNDSAWSQEIVQATSVILRVRFLSAKPIRQALLRLMELRPSETSPDQIRLAREFVDRKFENSIIVAVSYEMYKNTSSAALGPYFQAFSSAITSSLKNNTYLQVKDARVFLEEYQPPTHDGLGARFVFPRHDVEKLLTNPKNDWLRFYADWPAMTGMQLTINARFRVANFLYEGSLEY